MNTFDETNESNYFLSTNSSYNRPSTSPIKKGRYLPNLPYIKDLVRHNSLSSVSVKVNNDVFI